MKSQPIAELANVAENAAFALVQTLQAEQPEVAGLAVEMIQAGQATLRFDLALTRPAGIRLLLSPADCEGAPVELAAIGCTPDAPSAEGLTDRIWFFGRLSHWRPHH